MKIQRHYWHLSDEQKESMLSLEKKYMKRTALPKNPHDPYFYHIYTHTFPPEQAYRINDDLKKNLRAESMEKVQTKGFIRRWFYGGWNNQTAFEREWI